MMYSMLIEKKNDLPDIKTNLIIFIHDICILFSDMVSKCQKGEGVIKT